jgi:hypothetical protein
MKSHVLGLALFSAAAIIATTPAQAQNGTLTRSFVSSSGVDGNPCTVTQPCASFAHAYTTIGANGIIAALDPGKYGPLTITGPVTINGNGWAAITGPAQGNGITVNASSGNVILSGLEIDGAGAAYNGIVFTSGSSLTISNCIVKDFIVNSEDSNGTSGNGILIAPTFGTINFTIANTVAVNNANAGIAYLPPSGSATATGAIDHVVANNNGFAGITTDLYLTPGGSAAVSISNSVASNNFSTGISTAGSANIAVTLDADEISNNIEGVNDTAGTILLSHSVITKNSAYGVANFSTIYTYQDNRIYLNGNNNVVYNNSLTPVSPQ